MLGVGLGRQNPPVREVVVEAVTLHPLTMKLDVEKQLVVAVPEAEPLLQATKTSVTVCGAPQLEVDDSSDVVFSPSDFVAVLSG